MADRLDLDLDDAPVDDVLFDEWATDTRGTEADHCWCSICGLHFTSVRPFDEHRTGDIDHRRCRTEDELRERGLEPNQLGRWRRPRPLSTIPRKE